MLKNYFKTSIRNLFKNKTFSFINISGLALGMGCSLMIWLWVRDERGIDGFHANDRDLYTIFERQYHDGQVFGQYNTPGPLSQELKLTYPEVKYITSMAWTDEYTFQNGEKILKESGNFGSPDFFSVFSYPLLEGKAETALRTTGDIAISRKMAIDFFGSPQAAIGQPFRFQNNKDLTVTAVFENIPNNSSVKFDFMLNWDTFLELNSWAKEWGNNGPNTYVVLKEGSDANAFEKKIVEYLDKHDKNKNFKIRLALQKYSETYLHGSFKEGEFAGGRIEYVNLFSIIAVFVLLIACINFMNLTTARSVKRAKEIGVRKVIGALRGGLIRQFIGEALLIVTLSFVLAFAMVALALPLFNTITQKQISIPFGQLSFWISIVALTVITGFVSGSYPALYLSAFNPVNAFKGTVKFGSAALWFRKGLVIFQFTLSLILIIGTIVISNQVRYVQSVQLGYDRENLIYIPLDGDLAKNFELFKTQTLSKPGVQLMSSISQSPTSIQNGTGGVQWDGKDPNSMIQFTQARVGLDFLKTMKVALTDGRDFSQDFVSDSTGYIINEAALKIIGYKDPIGRALTFWGKKGTIIGVVKDFHFTSLHLAINPLVLRLDKNLDYGVALVRTEPGKTKKVLAGLEQVCKTLNPKFPFTYQFSDVQYQNMYKTEAIIETLSNAFAFLAIFISCLGLLGLAMFTSEQRVKEIGIRKILGASLVSLFGLLSRELLALVAVALVIASPLAWYVMNDWLNAYAYKIQIGWWMFVFAAVMAIFIALITISFQTIKALLVNPVNSLRSE